MFLEFYSILYGLCRLHLLQTIIALKIKIKNMCNYPNESYLVKEKRIIYREKKFRANR